MSHRVRRFRNRSGSAGAHGELSLPEQVRLRRTLLGIVGRMPPRLFDYMLILLFDYLEDHGSVLGLDLSDYDLELVTGHGDAGAREERRPLVEAMLNQLRCLPSGIRTNALDRRIGWLVGTLGLDELEGDLLAIMARYALFEPWQALGSLLPGKDHALSGSQLALLTGRSAPAVEKRILSSSRLQRTGLIDLDTDGDLNAGAFLRQIAGMQTSSSEVLTRRMLPAAPQSDLDWADFSHMEQLRDLATAAIRAAARTSRGINVLFHGLAGTGKSELARLVADTLGLAAVFVGLSDEDGNEPSRHERLAHLNVVRGLTRQSRKHIIVVDEADDVLNLMTGDGLDRRSKLWLNRLVEEVDVPTIWITNDPARLGKTVVRRMHLALTFDLPPQHVRRRVVTRAAARSGIALDAAGIERVAELPAAPAVLTGAIVTAKLANGGAEDVRRAGESILEALGSHRPASRPLPSAYDPSLAHTDHDLVALAERLGKAQDRGWSLLFEGPSGTGKSAYARHLAASMGVEIVEQRGSDLLSPFVGGTEANIAGAFRRARDLGALLLIDEADSFLFDRRIGTRSWETSMVNEMLRWMEELEAPFIATTNRSAEMDPATRRRFTLRIHFQPLTPSRAARLFSRWFQTGVPAGEPLEGMTPGDFAVVAHRAALLDIQNPVKLVSWLRDEVTGRGDGRGRAGFHLPHPEPQLRA